MRKQITAYRKQMIVECDERCDLVEFNDTYENDCGKPDSVEGFNKWCFRSCPRLKRIKVLDS